MTRAVDARIDLTALRHNLRQVRILAPNAKVIAIIKANAYGHGLVRAARALDETDAFGVACFEEAIALREAAVSKPIILLAGFFEAVELELACQYDLSVVIHHPSQLEHLEHAALKRPIKVWLKIDSGMHRLGIAPDLALSVWQRLNQLAGVVKPIGLMTHLASADDLSSDQTPAQLECFDRVVANLPGEQSIANSAAILAWPGAHRQWVRPGLMLFGISSVPTPNSITLKPAMTLTSRLIAINRFKQGSAIGYNASFVCPQDMPVGVISIGYGDGYPRHAAPGTPVLIKGQRVPLIGRVSMDTICVDLRDHPNATIGDIVELWGSNLPVGEIAQHSGTIAYELLCKVTNRVKFFTAD